MLRRLTASLLAVFMLHLSFLGADLACSKHGDESARNTAGETTHGAHAATAGAHDVHSHGQNTHEQGAYFAHAPAPHSSFTSTSDEAPCEIPAQSNCCQAFMGCSIVFSPNTQFTVAASIAPRALNVGNAQRAPLSDIPAPEPPPPRA